MTLQYIISHLCYASCLWNRLIMLSKLWIVIMHGIYTPISSCVESPSHLIFCLFLWKEVLLVYSAQLCTLRLEHRLLCATCVHSILSSHILDPLSMFRWLPTQKKNMGCCSCHYHFSPSRAISQICFSFIHWYWKSTMTVWLGCFRASQSVWCNNKKWVSGEWLGTTIEVLHFN